MPDYFAPASRGTETVLAEELRELGIEPLEVHRGGVAFGGSLDHAYRACLWSRVASRVLLPLVTFRALDAERFYDGVRQVVWTDHLGPEQTLAVTTAGGNNPAGPPNYLTLKTKDAIVDTIRDATGSRPSVDTERPDVRIHVHLRGPQVTVSIDLAGVGLHHRGIRRQVAAAPLKENLAAALLRIAGWPADLERPLFDPMCGSGTLLVEAAAMALDIAPGLRRERFGAERWRGHDAALWQGLLSEARERQAAAQGRPLSIAGSDASKSAVRSAREHLGDAGLADRVRVSQGELRDARPPWQRPGLLITNPPYGSRVGETGELGPLYETLGDVLKRRFPGWTGWILSGNRALDKRIGLRPSARHVVFNGPIECRLLEIPVADEPVVGERGPGWRKPAPEAAPFARKLASNLKRLRPWAKLQGLDCYRIYDSDIPEFNLSVDWYAGGVRVEEYGRPRKVSVEDAERRLRDAMLLVPEALKVEPQAVVLRVRRKLEPGEQHERYADSGRFREVREGDLRFRVNLTDYLDTGLFLDDRLLRARIRQAARGRDMLNLYAYTCAASVAAAAGGARSTTSVDLSNVYLRWGEENFRLNGLAGRRHEFLRTDAARFLEQTRQRYDLAFVAPPTWSRSKGMAGDFDVQRDHVALLRRVAARLNPGGEILFATNLRSFVFDENRFERLAAAEITDEITPLDFRQRPRLRAWRLRAAGGR